MSEKAFKSVLLIGNFLSVSVGSYGVSEALRLRLVERGWKVYYASRRANKLLRLADMLVTVCRFRRSYRVANVDVFSGAAFIWAEWVACLLQYLRKPFILTLWGGALPDFTRRYPWRVKRLLRSASLVNTPSTYLHRYFATICPDIHLLSNGIDLANYPCRERTYQNPHLVWLRAFHEIYNPQMAVEAFAMLRNEFKEGTLTMIGPDKRDGSYEACLALARRLDVRHALQLVGPVDKSTVPQWLDKGDVFLNTTRFESFGVSVMEAAACGLPIVTTNVGELPYIWQDGVDALLVPPDDPAAMAAAVRRILSENGLAQRLAQNARRKAEGFDWSLILPQWESIFHNLLTTE